MGEERNIYIYVHTHTHVYIKQIYTEKKRLIGVLSSHTKPRGRAVLPWALSVPCGLDSQESTCNVGDPGLIPRSGKSPGEGHGNTLQCPCLENAMDGRAWWTTYNPWSRK